MILPMSDPVPRKFTFADLRAARAAGRKTPFLTCYDYTTARLMQAAGVSGLLVGDSAANVILGHDSTLPVSLSFMIEITAAVRRGAPLALLMADMPFGSYQGSIDRGVRAVSRMVKLSGCDCVKIEAGPSHLGLVSALADAGVAMIAHLGLRPQSVGLLGGYRFQGRTADEAAGIVKLAMKMEKAGAAGLLLEAVPREVAAAVVAATGIPVIGCGAGDPCHGSVIVTHDAIGLTPRPPKFAPAIADLGLQMEQSFAKYVEIIRRGEYPAPEHRYEMPAEEKTKFLQLQQNDGALRG
jgi:3-methyl-2-oxobutanoate hydroxymethyltransferase